MQLLLPGLQRAGSRACVSCGAAADAYCARCGVTPYCSTRCQKRDWQNRHSAVCHNLARLNPESEEVVAVPDELVNVPAAAPLRRPRSPPRESPTQNDEEVGPSKSFIKPYQSSQTANANNQDQGVKIPPRQNEDRPDRAGRPFDKGGRTFDKGDRSFDKGNRSFDKGERSFDKVERSFDKGERSFDKGERSFDKGERSFDKGERSFDKRERSFDKGDRSFDKGDRSFDKGNRSFDKGEGSFDKGERSFDKGERSFDKGERSFDKGERSFDKGERSFDKGERSFDKGGRQFDNRNRQFNKHDRPTGGRPMPRPGDEEDWGNKGNNCKRPWKGGRAYQNQTESTSFQRRQENGVARCCRDDENWDAKPEPKPQTEETPAPIPGKTSARATQSVATVLANQNAPPAPSTNERVAAAVAKPAAANQSEGAAGTVKAPGSMADVTPTRKLVPKHCVIETLSAGDSVLLTVESAAAECRAQGSGVVCVSVHERYQEAYQALCCDAFGGECRPQPDYIPAPGESFACVDPADGAWYRARCLAPPSPAPAPDAAGVQCALLDAGRVLALPPAAPRARLPAQFEHTPEMCCILRADVQIGESLSCKLVEKSGSGWVVELHDVESGAARGGGEVARWLPAVQYPPAPAPALTPAPAPAAAGSASAAIPEVPRPAVRGNSPVLLVEVVDLQTVFVRPADPAAQRAHDTLLHDTALYGLTATPLSEPPLKGQVVVSKFTDEIHYRALVKRTSVKQNKYLLEYLEYGNSHINTLECLYPCPESLRPGEVVTSRVALAVPARPLAARAQQYLDALKESEEPLTLTIADGSASAPSGCAVVLTTAAGESVNRRVEELNTPDWERMLQRGGDALAIERRMYDSLEFVPIPEGESELVVLDSSMLSGGTLSACPPTADLHRVHTVLSQRMKEYCESPLGREPYFPCPEELCIAKLNGEWHRAVVVDKKPGEPDLEVNYIDWGNMARVPAADVRPLLPEFVDGHPALATVVQIEDFPKQPTRDQLERALRYLRGGGGAGGGRVRVVGAVPDGSGMCTVRAPELLRHMNAA